MTTLTCEVLREARSGIAGAFAADVALLGCGVVGSAVAKAILSGAGPNVRLRKVLVRHADKMREVPRSLVTTSLDDVLSARPRVVIEAMGGRDAALACVSAALARGISVVTANKTLMAHHGERLLDLARRRGAALRYEAAVCAAIPLLTALEHLRGDRVLWIRAITSGTCNFILSAMARGRTYGDALAEAQRLGLAEADPSADVSGRDSAEKACVLASAIGLRGWTPDRVRVRGMEGITSEDAACARRGGHAIRLITEIDPRRSGAAVRVGPALVRRGSGLGQVDGADNCVRIGAALAGELYFQGPGAGPRPTASAVLGDVAACLRGNARGARAAGAARPCDGSGERVAAEKSTDDARHVMRITRAGIRPADVLGALRARGLVAQELEVSARAARVWVTRGCEEEVEAAARQIGGETLVMRVIEDEGGAR